VLRNAMIPITIVAGLTVAGLIAGDVVVEQAFGISGLGALLDQSVAQKDFAVVQAISLILVTVFVVVNALVDVVNAALDPRVRAGAKA
jgi:peptide/nickel transport system permease protein